MGSATSAAFLAAIVFLGSTTALVGSAPVSSASVLSQIEEANTAEKSSPAPPGKVPVLRKHYVEVSPGVFIAVKGKRERRQIRHARLRKGYAGDRATIYGREGFPTFRHRENDGGIRTEHWTYLQGQVTYIFSGDRLVAVRPF